MLTNGDKWIKLLRAYGPVADNDAMQAEHVGKLSAYLGIPKLAFDHPARKLILDCFPVSTGAFRNVVLTGTAGEGKTSLCFELVYALNLSMIPSEKIMSLCLTAVLDRPEWGCFAEESDKPLFAESSSLFRNYHTLNSPEVRSKLVMLARIADMTGHHLPTRGVLCLLSNALLGHPDARDRVIRPGSEANSIAKSGMAHKAALHRTLFGENLTTSNRRKREVYRFLSMLHVGDETTNDLDELLIFGTRDEELKLAYDDLVSPDPYQQRNPDFDALLKRYIRGDLNGDEETALLLAELAAERRRVFIHASQLQLQRFLLWRITIFHHAREYLDEILKSLEEGKSPGRLHLRKLASGLNRIWTGLLLAENANEVYLATGLDLTTSAVSDIHLAQIDLDSEPPGMEVVRKDVGTIPEIVLRTNGREFRFSLTLPRFEFLCRVADGAMPSSFSRESCADFMSLKQRCLRDLQIKASSRSLHLIEVHGAGIIQRLPIHLVEK